MSEVQESRPWEWHEVIPVALGGAFVSNLMPVFGAGFVWRWLAGPLALAGIELSDPTKQMISFGLVAVMVSYVLGLWSARTLVASAVLSLLMILSWQVVNPDADVVLYALIALMGWGAGAALSHILRWEPEV